METKTPEELRNLFWEEDRLNGSIIKSQYDQIKEVIRKKDLEWGKSQLKKIKKHAINETAFYKDLNENDLFPVINKTIILNNYDTFKARSGFIYPLHVSSTSGSTGTPFSIMQDYKKRCRTIADLKVFGELADYPSHERMIFFRVLNNHFKRTKDQEDRENIYYIDSSLLDEEHLYSMIQVILEKQPRIIFSYSSTLVELSKFAEKKGYCKNDFSLKSILCAGEGISEKDRQQMSEIFGCKVFRRYSDMELGILAQDMGDGGKYHLNIGSYYFECLKLNSDEPVNPGEIGRIVITDLFNYAFPIIRYDTGDIGVLGYEDNVPFFSEIFGRSRDVVYTPEGILVSPAKISTSMWGLKGLKQWQFIQETNNEYTICLNGDQGLDTLMIYNNIKEIFGPNAIISIKLVDEIPILSSNKRRAIINRNIEK